MQNNYLVLARKYRPVNFDYLVGQEALVTTLSNSIVANKVAHAFILTGIRGVGKTTTARIIAKSLNCIGVDGEGKETINPCGECHNCISITQSQNQDVIEMDAASRTGVDDIREIINSICYAPVASRYKIYIIDEVHMLSKNAFNALLKTLEEPPAYIKFIFATTEIKKIPSTIMSRCQNFALKNISITDLQSHLKNICEKEKLTFEPKALSIIAKIAAGSIRDALSILDQIIVYSHGNITEQATRDTLKISDQETVFNIFQNLISGNTKQTLEIYHINSESNPDPILLIDELMNLCNLIAKTQILGEAYLKTRIETQEYLKQVNELSQNITMSVINQIWEILTKGFLEVKTSHNPFLTMEMLLIRIAYISTLPSIESIVNKLSSKQNMQTQSPSQQEEGLTLQPTEEQAKKKL